MSSSLRVQFTLHAKLKSNHKERLFFSFFSFLISTPTLTFKHSSVSSYVLLKRHVPPTFSTQHLRLKALKLKSKQAIERGYLAVSKHNCFSMDSWIMYRRHLFSCPNVFSEWLWEFEAPSPQMHLSRHACVIMCVRAFIFPVKAHKTYYSFIPWHLGLVKWTHPTHPNAHIPIKKEALYVGLGMQSKWLLQMAICIHSRGFLLKMWKPSPRYGGFALSPVDSISMWLASRVDGYIFQDWWDKYLPRS